MNTQNIVTYLKKHEVFESLSEAYLIKLAEQTQVVAYEAGETIFRAGDPASFFFLLMDGQIGIYTGMNSGGEVLVHTVDAREILGLSWIVPPYRWEFDAKAIAACNLIKFDGVAIREQCERDPVFGYGTLKKVVGLMLGRLHGVRAHMAERIRVLENQLEDAQS